MKVNDRLHTSICGRSLKGNTHSELLLFPYMDLMTFCLCTQRHASGTLVVKVRDISHTLKILRIFFQAKLINKTNRVLRQSSY